MSSGIYPLAFQAYLATRATRQEFAPYLQRQEILQPSWISPLQSFGQSSIPLPQTPVTPGNGPATGGGRAMLLQLLRTSFNEYFNRPPEKPRPKPASTGDDGGEEEAEEA